MNKINNNDNKRTIKNQRVKALFLQAAKEIIISEGVGNVTVRKIADMTGYSYATIYHYFRDLNELLMEVKTVMIRDLMEYMKLHTVDLMDSLDGIKKQNHIFIDYFIEHPNIYIFFYSYQLDTAKIESGVKNEFGENNGEIYQIFVTKGAIKAADVPVIAKAIIYSVYGALAVYFSNNGLTINKLYEDIDQVIDFLLNSRENNYSDPG